MKKELKKKIPGIILLFGLIVMLVLKGLNDGNDINVYLYASQQLFDGLNIYTNNPYNNYLYSPLFAILLWPFTLFPFPIARVIWHLANLYVIFRIWKIVSQMPKLVGFLSEKQTKWWNILILLMSIGFFIHNVNLGQVTFLIMWLTIEGLYLVLYKEKNWQGALLLALGINIKIIPLLALFYLFFKQKYRALVWIGTFLLASFILPGFVIGHKQNIDLMLTWKETISPTGKKYTFENNDGCISLNASIPAYFYDFGGDVKGEKLGLERKLFFVEHNVLVAFLQVARFSVVAFFLLVILYRRKSRDNTLLYFFWELSVFTMVTLLIFPHQMKYSLFLFIPVEGYLLLFIFRTFNLHWKISLSEKFATCLSLIILAMFSLMGRDIIGNRFADILGFYQFVGISNILTLWILWVYKPEKLNLNSK